MDTRAIQHALNSLGSQLQRLVEDGNYGSKTRARVMEFQRLNGLDQTGLVDESTREQLSILSGVELDYDYTIRGYDVPSYPDPVAVALASQAIANAHIAAQAGQAIANANNAANQGEEEYYPGFWDYAASIFSPISDAASPYVQPGSAGDVLRSGAQSAVAAVTPTLFAAAGISSGVLLVGGAILVYALLKR